MAFSRQALLCKMMGKTIKILAKGGKNPEKTPGFWTAKSGKKPGKNRFWTGFFRRPGKNTFFPSKTRTLFLVDSLNSASFLLPLSLLQSSLSTLPIHEALCRMSVQLLSPTTWK